MSGRHWAISLLLLCHSSGYAAEANIEEVASEYFAIYASRKDFNKFMDFYEEQSVLKDVIYDVEVIGRSAIRNFFDWERGEFKTATAGPILSINNQIISGKTVISTGVFETFYFNGEKLGPWEFVIWQEYNEVGKIVSQSDWINYSPKKILIGRNAGT